MQLDAFFPMIIPEVPGCPDMMVEHAIRMTAIDFCRDTLSWTEIQDPIRLVDNVSLYELDAPTDAMVWKVRDVWAGKRRLEPKSMIALQDTMPNWATAQGTDPIYYNAADSRDSIRVFPTPFNTTGQSMTVRVTYVPTATATSLPPYLGQMHLDEIAAGTKARLCMVPGKVWSNPEIGAYYKGVFDAAVTRSRIDESHDRVPSSLTVRPRSFGF